MSNGLMAAPQSSTTYSDRGDVQMRRCLRAGRFGLAVAGAAWLWAAVTMAQDIDRRLERLEDTHADVRLAKLETRLESIDAVLKGVLIAVVVQIVVSGIGLRQQKGNR